MLHLGPRTFDELGGEVVQNVSFVISNCKPQIARATYYRLVEGRNCEEKHRAFIEGYGRFSCILQENFKKIPGSPIGYWVSQKMITAFAFGKIDDISTVITGMTIGDNNKYLRLWGELSKNKLAFRYSKMEDVDLSETNWIPYSKGGSRRNWYGGYDYVVNWLMKDNFNRSKTTLQHLYLKEAVTWPFICSGTFSAKYLPEGFLWDVAGSPCFFNNKSDLLYTLSFLVTKICNTILKISNPTINVQAIDVARLPLKKHNVDIITSIANSCIGIAKSDWDAHETSWDFQQNELVALQKDGLGIITAGWGDISAMKYSDLGLLYLEYEAKWREKFKQLHANEVELNRQFIEIYGLQYELTPDVPLDEITILQQGEIKIENGEVVFQKDEVMRQFVSYLVGLIMGRYRLDRPGLNIAHPNPSAEELSSYEYNGLPVEIDGDGIMPLMSGECSFADNALKRITELVRVIFGNDNHATNMAFINDALGKALEDYLVKDFYADHLKRYQKRPIYWLFSSKKGAFKVLAYMHRMDRYTAEMIRNKYLLPHIENQRVVIADLESRASVLTTAERKKLERLRKEHEECLEYHERLHAVADEQIGFDLDDGVVVNYAKFGDVLAKLK